jgi:hypothetical protein
MKNDLEQILDGRDRRMKKAVEMVMVLLKADPSRPVLAPPFPHHIK